MNKNASIQRQDAVKKLINDFPITDQKSLVDLLKEKFGIETNQSALSRDLRKLGVVKKEVDNELIYTLPVIDVTINLLKLAVLEVKHNETMIVVKTHAGLAAFVGDHLDAQENLNILGCLAGENIVFIACQTNSDIHQTYNQICQTLHFKKI